MSTKSLNLKHCIHSVFQRVKLKVNILLILEQKHLETANLHQGRLIHLKYNLEYSY